MPPRYRRPSRLDGGGVVCRTVALYSTVHILRPSSRRRAPTYSVPKTSGQAYFRWIVQPTFQSSLISTERYERFLHTATFYLAEKERTSESLQKFPQERSCA